MKNLLWLGLSALVVTAATAQDRSGFFPFVKGRYWLYDGTARFLKDGEEQEKKITGWRSEVVDTVAGKDFKAALLTGSPGDLAWYKEGKERAAIMYLLKENGEFVEFSDAEKNFAKLKTGGRLPADLVDKGEIIFKTSMKEGDRFGDPEQVKINARYCWVVSTISKEKLDPAAKGVPAGREFTTYSLTYKSAPSHSRLNFTAGVGITFYEYVHHGTPGACEMRLVETGVKSAEPGKPENPH